VLLLLTLAEGEAAQGEQVVPEALEAAVTAEGVLHLVKTVFQEQQIPEVAEVVLVK
jgi:hypothetical protein